MVKALFALIFLLCLLGPAHSQTVTIYHGNSQHGMGTDNVTNAARQINIVAAAGIDIVGMNEVATGDVNAYDSVFASNGMSRALFDEHPKPGDGNAIWYRPSTTTLIQTYTHDLANGPNPTSGSSTFGFDGATDIRRSAVAAKFSKSGRQFYVVAVHFCQSVCEDSSSTNFAQQRVTQITDLLNWINTALTGLPVVVIGDFNMPPNYPRAPERSFTADANTDTITAAGHGWANGAAVVLRNSGGAVPGGLATGDSLYASAPVYYVRDATTNTFKLAANRGGSAIDLTSNGTGSNFVVATQWDLFISGGYDDLWQTGLANVTATVPWGDRDADGIPDMPLGFQTSRTHDSRRIDYAVLKGSGLTLNAIQISDLRANCSVALVSGGNFKQCPDVSQLIDFPEDQGVRPSDHNFLKVTLNLAQAAPTASLSCPATAFVGEPVVCDGSASTDVHGQLGWSTTTFSDGTAPVAMDFGDGQGPYSHSELLRATHAYTSPGTYTVNLTVRNTAGVSASTSAQITVNAIPAANGGAIQTLTDTGNNATNCTALQNAYNTAAAANTVEQEIRIPAITYTCVITPPAVTGTKYITLRPVDISWLPGPLTRVTPALSINMPKLNAPHGNGAPIQVFGVNRRYLRFLGIEMMKPAGLIMNSLIMIGTDGGTPPTAYNQIPDHIIFDRCYFHGNATDDTTRGMLVHANDFSVLNSYFTGFHDSGADSQAIAVMDGKRQALINNYLEAYGENLLWGGSATFVKFSATASSGTSTSATLSSTANLNVGDGISFMVGGSRGPWSASIVRSIAGLQITFDPITNQAGVPTAPDTTADVVKYGSSPADIFIARNHLYKSTTFRVGAPEYAGVFAVVKNSFELKHAMRVVFTSNVIENMWGNQGQDGHTVLFTPRNQTCFLPAGPDPNICPSQDNPWAAVRDVEFSHTRIKNIPDLFNILGTDNLNPPGFGGDSGPSALAQYFAIRELLVEGTDPGGAGTGQLALLWPGTRNVTFAHITQVNVAGGSWILSSEAPIGHVIANALVVSNIAPHQFYGVFGDGRFIQNFMPYFMPDGAIRHNVLSNDFGSIGPNGEIWSAPQAGPNSFPATINTNTFINLAGGNYRLKPDSPYKGTAADGTDPGVNFDDLLLATNNVVSGNWAVVLTNTGTMRGKTTLRGGAVIK